MDERAAQIADLKRELAALRERDQDLLDFIENASLALHFVGDDGRIVWANQAELDLLGYTREELMSKPFIEFVHPDDRERTLKQNASVREGGHALHFENRYMCKDGTYRWFLWNAAPDSAEQVIYSVARDITVRKQAEEEREKLV